MKQKGQVHMGKRRSDQKSEASKVEPPPIMIECPFCGDVLPRRDAKEHFTVQAEYPCRGYYGLYEPEPAAHPYVKIYQGGRVSPR